MSSEKESTEQKNSKLESFFGRRSTPRWRDLSLLSGSSADNREVTTGWMIQLESETLWSFAKNFRLGMITDHNRDQ
jgi:hypothetical protein